MSNRDHDEITGSEGDVIMCKMEWMKKIIIIWIGSIIAAYGITLAMYAGFGGATLAVLWQGISKTFHISIGMASMIVAVGMLIFVFSMTDHSSTLARFFIRSYIAFA